MRLRVRASSLGQLTIRLADSQRVTAIAAMSDGSFWSGEASVVVTIAACIDGG